MSTDEQQRQRERAAWVARLEKDPQWTERLREIARLFCLRCSDLVLLVATPEEFPLTATRADRIDRWIVTVGRVSDLGNALPTATRDTMSDRDRHAFPDHSHALIFFPPLIETIRFRVPK
jgi:hypothetical protein